MTTTDSILFSVGKREDYQQPRERELSVEDLGRHNYEDAVDFETWSRESGDPVPESCQIPFVHLPRTLPISLKMGESHGYGASFLFSDPTQLNYEDTPYKIKLPPIEIPEFIPEFFSIGKILMWATREKVDLRHADFFILSCVLRDIAATAVGNSGKKAWKYAVFCYKGNIFIDRTVSDKERYWKEGLKDCPVKGSEYWKLVEKTPCEVLRDRNSTFKYYWVPYFDLSDESKNDWDFCNHGLKFEKVMRGYESDIKGKVIKTNLKMAKCDKFVSLGNHKIMTATRISCQEPNGIIDSQENHVEMKVAMSTQSPYNFAKYKALKLWIHCALVGVDAVYCGFRNEHGKLSRVRKYTMSELAKIGEQHWSPNEVLTFLDTFLSWLKEKLILKRVRRKRREDWLVDYLNCDEGATFTLTYLEPGENQKIIRLDKSSHPELKKIVTERYNYVIQEHYHENDNSDAEVPDNWDD